MWPLAQTTQPPVQTFVNDLARTPLSQVLMFVAGLTVLRLLLSGYLRNTKPHQRTGFYPVAKIINELSDALVYAGVFVFMLIRPFGVQTFLIPTGSMVPTLLVSDFIVANKAIYRYSDPKVGDIVVFRPPSYAVESQFLDKEGVVNVDYIKRCLGAPGETVFIKDGQLFRNGQPDPDKHLNFTLATNPTASAFQMLDRTADRMQDFKLVKYEGPYEPWKGKTIPVMTENAIGLSEPTANYQNPIDREFAIGAADDSNTTIVRRWKSWDELTAEEKARMKYLAEAPPAPIPPAMYLMIGDNRNHSFDGRFWGLVGRDQIVGKSEFIWLPFSRIGPTR
jgi:signal peptidase I